MLFVLVEFFPCCSSGAVADDKEGSCSVTLAFPRRLVTRALVVSIAFLFVVGTRKEMCYVVPQVILRTIEHVHKCVVVKACRAVHSPSVKVENMPCCALTLVIFIPLPRGCYRCKGTGLEQDQLRSFLPLLFLCCCGEQEEKYNMLSSS